MVMRVTLTDRDGAVATTGEIPDAPSFPEGFLFEGKMFIIQRIITGRKEAVYRQRIILTMPDLEEIDALQPVED